MVVLELVDRFLACFSALMLFDDFRVMTRTLECSFYSTRNELSSEVYLLSRTRVISFQG